MASLVDLLSTLHILPLIRLDDGSLHAFGGIPALFVQPFPTLPKAGTDIQQLFPLLGAEFAELQDLVGQLAIAEERERHKIAELLQDRIGQNLVRRFEEAHDYISDSTVTDSTLRFTAKLQ